MKLPRGFLASGIRAGIRKKRPDLGLIHVPNGANAVAVFTQNAFLAAPVVLSIADKTGDLQSEYGGSPGLGVLPSYLSREHSTRDARCRQCPLR